MDTIKKIANAILDAGEGCQSGRVYVDPVEAAKAAIAALSTEERSYRAGFNDGWEAANGEPPDHALSTDAEPVAWASSRGNMNNLVSHKRNATFNVPLYAAPPAPSVAVKVKALRWKGPDSYGEYHSLDGLWGYIIRCEDDGHWLTEVGDYFRSPEAAQAAAQADYEARIRSALA